jgi:heat shock protein HslJ
MSSPHPPSTGDLIVGRTFLVTAIGGVAALSAPTAVLTFDGDGRVSGRATINRVSGAYRVEGDELLCGPLAMTLMAGEPAAMVQEQELLAVLGAPLVVRAVPEGVELVAPDGRAVTLRESGGDDLVT